MEQAAAKAEARARQAAQEEAAARAAAAEREAEKRLRAEKAAALKASQEAAELAAAVEAERAEKERLRAELEEIRLAREAAEEKRRLEQQGIYDLTGSGLSQWHARDISSTTAVYDKVSYAWGSVSIGEEQRDSEIFDLLRRRLRSVHTTPADALASIVGETRLVRDPMAFASHGVDPAVFVAFCNQLCYLISDAHAARMLMNVSGGLPIVPVPRFLELLTASHTTRHTPPPTKLTPIKNDGLTPDEKGLLLSLRDSLFEQHSRMKTMFERCDKDGDGFVSIEEFLTAMERAGVPAGKEIDRKRVCISPEQACRIVGFFDKDGDGMLSYHEFMNILQATKTSVLTTKFLAGVDPQVEC